MTALLLCIIFVLAWLLWGCYTILCVVADVTHPDRLTFKQKVAVAPINFLGRYLNV